MNNHKKKILAILGSTKKISSNRYLLKHITDTYRDKINVEIYDRIDQLPHFNPDLDRKNPPHLISELRNKIQAADGVIICTPEYVFSLPGSLKNVIDWNASTTLFSNKPVALIVASASGKKALESLLLIMTTIESKIARNSSLLIQGVKGKIGKDGKINDTETANHLDILIRSLLSSIDEKG